MVVVALSVAFTLGVIFLFLLITGILPWGEDLSFVQHGTVRSPEDFGSVNYEVPFGSVPQLTIDGQKYSRTTGEVDKIATKGRFRLSNQTPTGFEWRSLEGIKGTSFGWEAKGRAVQGPAPLFVQKGSFLSVNGESGQVNFPHRYESPPNVELNGRRTIIVETTSAGFKWKNTGTKADFAEGTLEWVAKGVKGK
jgi:hypothetical protein